MEETNQTRVNHYLSVLNNHRFLSLLILVGTVVIGLATFTDSLSRLTDFVVKVSQSLYKKQPEQWSILLRIQNCGPDDIMIGQLCELNLTETDESIIENYENARVILRPVNKDQPPFLLPGWEIRDFRVELPASYLKSSLFERGSANIHFIVKEENEYSRSIGIGSAPFILEVLRNGKIDININMIP